MFEVFEKRSDFIGTYYCVYLDDWLVLQTKNPKIAALCQTGRVRFGPTSFQALKDQSEAKRAAEAKEVA